MLAWKFPAPSACAALSAERPIARRSGARTLTSSSPREPKREFCRTYLVYSVSARATKIFRPSKRTARPKLATECPQVARRRRRRAAHWLVRSRRFMIAHDRSGDRQACDLARESRARRTRRDRARRGLLQPRRRGRAAARARDAACRHAASHSRGAGVPLGAREAGSDADRVRANRRWGGCGSVAGEPSLPAPEQRRIAVAPACDRGDRS